MVDCGQGSAWVGLVFFNPIRPSLIEKFLTQLNPTHYMYRNQPNPTLRVGSMGCALVVKIFMYYNKFWLFINYLSVCFSTNHNNSHDMPKLYFKFIKINSKKYPNKLKKII